MCTFPERADSVINVYPTHHSYIPVCLLPITCLVVKWVQETNQKKCSEVRNANRYVKHVMSNQPKETEVSAAKPINETHALQQRMEAWHMWNETMAYSPPSATSTGNRASALYRRAMSNTGMPNTNTGFWSFDFPKRREKTTGQTTLQKRQT